MTSPGASAEPRSPRRSARAEFVYACVGLAFAIVAWLINPWFIVSLVALIFAIRAIVRGRKLGGRPHTVVLTIGIVALILAILAIVGTALAVMVPVG